MTRPGMHDDELAGFEQRLLGMLTDAVEHDLPQPLLTGDIDRRSRIRVPRRWTVPLVALLVLALSAVGAAAYLLTRPAQELTSLGCYETADLDGNVAVVEADGRDPIEVCRQLWEQGAMGDKTEPPALQACVLDTGPAAVVPGEPGVCEQLGVARLDTARFVAETGQFDRFKDAVIARVASEGACHDEASAKRIVGEELDRHNLDGWDIVVHRHPTNPAPCALVGFDTAGGNVRISFPEQIEQPSGDDRVATGKSGEISWEIQATYSPAGTLCLTIIVEPQLGDDAPRHSGCGYDHNPPHDGVGLVDNPVFGKLEGPEYRTVYGLVGPDVQEVEIELSNGTTRRIDTHDLGPVTGLDVRMFLLIPQDPHDDYTRLVAYNGDGKPLGTATPTPSPAPTATD